MVHVSCMANTVDPDQLAYLDQDSLQGNLNVGSEGCKSLLINCVPYRAA